MEIHMGNVSCSASSKDLILLLARHIHRPPFLDPGDDPFNFDVHLLPDHGYRQHRGVGFLTLPSQRVGSLFLSYYGLHGIICNGAPIRFSLSRNLPAGRPEIVQALLRVPYIDPRVLDMEKDSSDELSSRRVGIKTLQFGFDCRDKVLSIESEASPSHCALTFNEERRQFRIEYTHKDYKYFIGIQFSQIKDVTTFIDAERNPIIFFTLVNPPTFEGNLKSNQEEALEDSGYQSASASQGSRFLPRKTGPLRKLSFLPLPEDHQQLAPYTSLAVRLVCQTKFDLTQFRHLSQDTGLRAIGRHQYPAERRGLFSTENLELYSRWLRAFPWPVAFQIEAIVRKRRVDLEEILDLVPDIHRIFENNGEEYTALLLQDFKSEILGLHKQYGPEDDPDEVVRRCFEQTCDTFDGRTTRGAIRPTDGSFCEVFHVTVTPTSFILDGPYPERSNRVLRAFPEKHHQSFLRVTFAEEGRLQLRFDRDVDSRLYLRERVRPLLMEGLTIAKRTFHFLAYSQSALKEHSVWFVKPFQCDGKWISAKSIIQGIGNFDNLEFDPELPYCPARYAARISQAFTATDASVSVSVEEIFPGCDITVVTNGQKHNFTDGVGTMSRLVAKEIWGALKTTRKRLRSTAEHPAAYQIRFKGSKGMLSIDYKLKGRLIVIRPSMIKFEAPHENNIEIARAFDRPTPYFLNRPLIMLLEGLGVPFETFKKFQDLAVYETEDAMTSFTKMGSLLECYGLGSSYRIASVLNSLAKLGINSLGKDRFYDKAMEFAKNHILRLLKYHARIPIPGAWTLVGVADVHKYLQPGQIFVCVRPPNKPAFYLKGPVLVSRSPTIHPGDVQIAQAIGRPPPGSCFGQEPLINTIVFSVLGERPLPSCLGGGDLDGDLYNIIPLNDPELKGFMPRTTSQAASYTSATKKLLNRKSTMTDVAEFVMDYIVSDVLGIVATNWLIIADQSQEGIYDPDCITLASLHSDAVDYPKSGNPVDPRSIPRLKFKQRPDWNAPETIDVHARGSMSKYYPSPKAIGKLFRAIDLPAQHHPMNGATKISAIRTHSGQHQYEGTTHGFGYSKFADEPYHSIIEGEVQGYIETEEDVGEGHREEAERLLERYTTELRGICDTRTLSSAIDASLTEEEAMVGTIVLKVPQSRRRMDMISRLREDTDILVRGIREQLEGVDGDTEEHFLQRSWFAWEASLDKGNEFGAQSFGWIALGAMFEAMKKIDEREFEED